MSTHPNVLLIAVLTPDDVSRRTMRAILEEAGFTDDGDSDDIDLPGGKKHVFMKGAPYPILGLHHRVMESDYEEDYQISAKEGDLLFFDLVTYGYGEFLTWEKLAEKKAVLEEWCKGICERHHCKYEIRVSANHW